MGELTGANDVTGERSAIDTRPAEDLLPHPQGFVAMLFRFGGPQMVEFVTSAFVGLVVGVFSARTLGPSGRGELALMLQVGYIVQIFMVAGSDRAALSRIGHESGRTVARAHLRFVSLVWLLSLVLGAVLVAAGAWFAGVAVLSAGMVVVFSGEQAVHRAIQVEALVQHRPWLSVGWLMPAQLTAIGLGLAFTAADVLSPRLWFLVYLLPYSVAVGLFLVSQTVTMRTPAPVGEFKAFAGRSFAFLPGSLSLAIALRSDRILLGVLGDTRQVGIYVAGATFMELAVAPAMMIADVAQTRWADQRARAGRPSGISKREFLIVPLLATVVAAGVWVATKWLVVPIFSGDFGDAVELALPLALAGALLTSRAIMSALAIVLDRKPQVVMSESIMAVVAVIGFVALIPGYGYMGAAWASVGAYAVGLGIVLNAVRSGWRAGEAAAVPVD